MNNVIVKEENYNLSLEAARKVKGYMFKAYNLDEEGTVATMNLGHANIILSHDCGEYYYTTEVDFFNVPTLNYENCDVADYIQDSLVSSLHIDTDRPKDLELEMFNALIKDLKHYKLSYSACNDTRLII